MNNAVQNFGLLLEPIKYEYEILGNNVSEKKEISSYENISCYSKMPSLTVNSLDTQWSWNNSKESLIGGYLNQCTLFRQNVTNASQKIRPFFMMLPCKTMQLISLNKSDGQR